MMASSSKLLRRSFWHVVVSPHQLALRGATKSLTSLFATLVMSIPCVRSDAQTNPSPPLPEVTVTAPRPPTPQELAGSAVADFIRVHAHPTVVTGQLPRWRIGICPPVTVGLSPRFNDFISARILAIAASVGAPVQEAGKCSRRNVYIVFTTEPQRALDALVKQDPKLLGFHYHMQTNNLETISRPIQGWYLTSSRGFKGDETIDEAEPLLSQGTGLLDQGKHPAGLPGSRLTSYISSAIVNVTIVADASKLVGRAIGSVADYLAVLTLTQPFSSEQCGTLPSIMDMMLSHCGEREKLTGITAGDPALLKSVVSNGPRGRSYPRKRQYSIYYDATVPIIRSV